MESKYARIFKVRNELLEKTRNFFKERGFTEVETPILVPYASPDDNIESVEVLLKVRGKRLKGFLHTSPEFFMKRLIALGMSKIFQICKVFRNDEVSRRHNIEFTMVEWYSTEGNYKDGIEETLSLLRFLLGESVVYNGKEINLSGCFVITVKEAFLEFAKVDPFDKHALTQKSKVNDYEESFFRILIEKVEPELEKFKVPVVLKDFPEEFSAMAEVRNGIAERFEVYVGGLELANGYTELRDPEEYLRRFLKKGKASVDEGFLKVIRENPLPKCYGVALGFDRVLMLATSSTDIKDVVPFTVSELFSPFP